MYVRGVPHAIREIEVEEARGQKVSDREFVKLPRISPTNKQRMIEIHHLMQNGNCTARDIAECTDIKLRRVQRILTIMEKYKMIFTTNYDFTTLATIYSINEEFQWAKFSYL